MSVTQMLKFHLSFMKVSVAVVAGANVFFPLPFFGCCLAVSQPRFLTVLVSCFGPRNDDSTVLICANWSMTCWSSEESAEVVLGLVTEGCVV